MAAAFRIHIFATDGCIADVIAEEKSEKMYRSIDLFAGIGGIRLGFEQAFMNDIKTVFASELDERAAETYTANFKDDFDIVGDITKVDEKTIPPHDILLVGFPCQAFSLAGRKKGFDDARGPCFLTLRGL